MSDLSISVIIPTYNRQDYILRAIKSVVKQEQVDFDLFIIDDGSTDNTQKVVLGYICEHCLSEKITYIKTENKGVSAARNLGIKKSNGAWLSFLDSDDEWLPGKLCAQVEFLQSNPSINIVHGDEVWIRNHKFVNQKKKHKKYGGRIFHKCLPMCLISPSAVMIKREVLLDAGCFDESFPVCEDYDLWLKLTSIYEVGFISKPIIKKYGGHDDQLSKKFFAMDYWRIKSLMNIINIRKFSPLTQTMIYNEIIYKANILLAGYKKHNNMEYFEEVKEIVEECVTKVGKKCP
ncbi:MAG: glycosyltransferase [Bacteriovoracaceae bacterium]|nr:glycosyltransferase [Bacteriovoracaceae bacterium]